MTEMESMNCTHLVHVGQWEFDMTKGHTNFIVRLQDKYCDCRKWQLTGLPCKHVGRCILRMKQQLNNYVEHCFIVEKYRNLYNHIIHPIAAPQMWDKRNLADLEPPYAQRKIGRPQEHKRRESLNTPLPESQSQQLSHKVLGSGTTRYKFHLKFWLISLTNMC